MNQLINDVAITITQQVYKDLFQSFLAVQGKDDDIPTSMLSYFQVRESIYKTLQKYIKNYRTEYERGVVDSRLSKEHVEVMDREAEKREAYKMVEEIFAANIHASSKYDHQLYARYVKDFLLIDINKIKNDAIGTGESLEIAFYYSK